MGIVVVPVPDPPVQGKRTSCLPWVVLALILLLLLGLLLGMLLSGGESPESGVTPGVTMEDASGIRIPHFSLPEHETTEATHYTAAPTEATRFTIAPTEVTAAPTETTPQNTRYRNGYCHTLVGNVAMVVLLVEDNESSWNDDAFAKLHYDCIQPAEQFLEDQAAAYGIALDIQVNYYSSDETRRICTTTTIDDNMIIKDGATYPGTESGTFTNGGLLEEIAKNWGFASADEMDAALRKSTGCEQIGYVLACNKTGWSHAFSGDRGTEFCFIFMREQGDDGYQVASTVAHEFLHLFGAEDLYQGNFADGGTSNDNRAALAADLCPTDIMYQTDWNSITNNSIAGYSAYCVGWLEDIPPQYDRPEWLGE